MQEDIRKSKKGNTAYLNVGVWYEADTRQIHVTLPHSGWFHTTVSGDPKSKRFHRSSVFPVIASIKGGWSAPPQKSVKLLMPRE